MLFTLQSYFIFQVFILEKVLAKKRDPLTHICFIEEFSQVSIESLHVYLSYPILLDKGAPYLRAHPI